MRPLTLETHSGRSDGPMTLAWLVPPWKVGSGGHTTIFRLIQQLEQRGHRCAIYVFDPFNYEPRTAEEIRTEIRTRFIPVDAQVFKGLNQWLPAVLRVGAHARVA